MVIHASAGKNTIGMASPGNSSGYFTSRGRLMVNGSMIAANELMEKTRLKMISPVLPFHFTRAKKRKENSMQTRKLPAQIVYGLMILE